MTDQKWVDFDYERYKDGDEVFYRNGDRFIGEILFSNFREKNNQYPIILIQPGQSISSCSKNGICYIEESNVDLVMKPKTKKLFILVRSTANKNAPHCHITSGAYESKEEAEKLCKESNFCYHVVEIEIEVD